MTTKNTLPGYEEEARSAFRSLLLERPEFMDTNRNHIQDVVPFLEEESGFPEWLTHYEGNNRALSGVWTSVIREIKKDTSVKETESKIELPKPEKRTRTVTRKPQNVENENTAIVPAIDNSPTLLEDQAIQSSRALAEQFAIVKHHELAIKQATQSIEQANEALVRARQDFAHATTAYTNALDDLARLLANSLGNKAGEFSKLLAKAAIGNQK
ncbi:MAG: hypothetical protein HXX08_20970 [Chloroflexi bacterium]|uniref:Uncharacterized protein n=1 Tax=Candidatus Chlorohelix allophototropha TaxID=3003348 RepID=A0A8T7M8I1_9CHLR|nr:hypothetical protein [Chloroflexota bacterium]WJW68270.1 hypothetical protein OZ401_003877 [Chloroflexota bacterium L227-S17]